MHTVVPASAMAVFPPALLTTVSPTFNSGLGNSQKPFDETILISVIGEDNGNTVPSMNPNV
jgi:hypothetical protein